jgi:hypothetical protein
MLASGAIPMTPGTPGASALTVDGRRRLIADDLMPEHARLNGRRKAGCTDRRDKTNWLYRHATTHSQTGPESGKIICSTGI